MCIYWHKHNTLSVKKSAKIINNKNDSMNIILCKQLVSKTKKKNQKIKHVQNKLIVIDKS